MEEKHLTPSFGAPQNDHTLLPSPGEEKGPTTARQRFGGFAVCHLGFSIFLSCSCPIWIRLFFMELVWAKSFLLGTFFMAAYFPMGYLTAAMEEWTVPQSSREKCLAVVYPMVVAWLWVAVVLVALFGDIDALFLVAVVLSLFLAMPSSGFVLIFGFVGGNDVGFVLIGLLAGFLPPFLFALGSFWQASRREKKNAKRTAEA